MVFVIIQITNVACHSSAACVALRTFCCGELERVTIGQTNATATMSEDNIKTPECASDGSRTQSLASALLTDLTVTEHAAVQTNMPRMNQSLAKGAQG